MICNQRRAWSGMVSRTIMTTVMVANAARSPGYFSAWIHRYLPTASRCSHVDLQLPLKSKTQASGSGKNTSILKASAHLSRSLSMMSLRPASGRGSSATLRSCSQQAGVGSVSDSHASLQALVLAPATLSAKAASTRLKPKRHFWLLGHGGSGCQVVLKACVP